MKTKKLKKRTQLQQQQPTLPKLEDSRPHKIKFDISQDSIACFIGEKNKQKKQAPHLDKHSKKAKKLTLQEQCELSNLQRAIQLPKKMKKTQCQQIIQDPLNEILSKIQAKGIRHKWEDLQDITEIKQETNYEQQSSQIWSDFSVNSSFEKSYASTIDMHPNNHYYTQRNNYPPPQPYYYDFQFKAFEEENNFLLKLQNIVQDVRTTIMIRNIPNKYTIKELSQEIDNELPNSYNFLYLPCDIKNQCNVGYGFINFLNTEQLLKFYYIFDGKKWLRFKSEKICNLTYARLQGLSNLIQHFANSKVLNQKDKRYRPIIRQFPKIQNLVKSQQLYE